MGVKLRNFEIGAKEGSLTVLAGPCAIEEDIDILRKTADVLSRVCSDLGINYIFKSSFDKANRTSINSYRGIGLDKGLEILSKIKSEFGVPIVTDVHLPEQCVPVAEVADVIQIPAFLCRQTDLLVAAAKTNRIVNIKKGQFLAPQQMKPLIKKVEDSGNKRIMLTERGTTFGYNNLVVDYRSFYIMKEFGYPVVFDATHSVQMPGANGESTGGDRRFVPLLAKAAVAAGVDTLFFEIHPNPDCAPCDGPNMLKLDDALALFKKCKEIYEIVRR